MLKRLRNLQSGRSTGPGPYRAPKGRRIYAIGDIHGRLDLLDALLGAIARDEAEQADGLTSELVLLGDLVDRGPDSRGVVARAMELANEPTTHVLGGNHEDMFLLAFRKPAALRSFLRYGGRETLESYGIDTETITRSTLDELQAAMHSAVPAEHRAFLEQLQDSVRLGDYLFVHAGIDPDRALDDQRSHDMRWIREPFLGHEGDHGVMVVHGHTITDRPHFAPNRIGIDTGAFDSGCLTALVLEGTARRIMQTTQQEGAITVATQEV